MPVNNGLPGVLTCPSMHGGQPHVLFVEDELVTRRIVEDCFRLENIRVSSVGSLAAARATLLREAIDLVLLDLTLPDGDGVTFCRELRKKNAVPLIMLTARAEAEEVVAGLESGADDYIVKPVSTSILVARVRANLRRAERDRSQETETLRAGAMTLDPERRTVEINGRAVTLGAKEFELLLLLARRAGRVVHRDEIFDEMWPEAERSEKILNVYIRRIREKIELEPSSPALIETVRGIGYRVAK